MSWMISAVRSMLGLQTYVGPVHRELSTGTPRLQVSRRANGWLPAATEVFGPDVHRLATLHTNAKTQGELLKVRRIRSESPFKMCRSVPQIVVLVILTMASPGAYSSGLGFKRGKRTCSDCSCLATSFVPSEASGTARRIPFLPDVQ
jgi:hypothetical protein